MDIQRLVERIGSKDYGVGVIGLGYVGLPLVMAFAQEGFRVLGFDIDQGKVAALNRGESYIGHIPGARVLELEQSGRFAATNDFSRCTEVDALLICVPTPLTAHREPDLRYVIDTARAIMPHLRQEHLVVLESTTYPTTTEEVLREELEHSGLKAGIDFLLAYSPEREDPGNPEYSTSRIPKVVGGIDAASLRAADALYAQIVPHTVPVSSARVAEAVKLTENIFRCVNIALVNELKVIYEKMGIDVWEVIDAAKTKPFGYMPFYPGPGLGGHCIPIDPFYLTWKAREYDCPTRFIELAGEVNTGMPEYVVQRLAEALNARSRSVNGAKILVLGLAYKKNVGDPRESPALELMRLLAQKGASADYHDPYVPVIPVTRRYARFAGIASVAWDAQRLSTYDAAIIATDHDSVDYAALLEAMSLVVDTRGVTRGLPGAEHKVVRA